MTLSFSIAYEENTCDHGDRTQPSGHDRESLCPRDPERLPGSISPPPPLPWSRAPSLDLICHITCDSPWHITCDSPWHIVRHVSRRSGRRQAAALRESRESVSLVIREGSSVSWSVTVREARDV